MRGGGTQESYLRLLRCDGGQQGDGVREGGVWEVGGARLEHGQYAREESG